MHTNTMSWSTTHAASLTVPLLVAIACFMSRPAHAVQVDSIKPIQLASASRDKASFPAAKGMSLKLDVSLLNPDDCEDEGDLMVASNMPRAGSQPYAASRQLAKSSVSDVVTIDHLKSMNASGAAALRADASGAQARPAPAASPVVTPKWEIVPTDKTLNAALARWAALAGWQLVWELPVDYAVEARTTVPGTFEEAVAVVAKSMDTAEIPLKAIFYAGNKVLRIVAKGVE